MADNITLQITYNANGGSNAPSTTITRVKAVFESEFPKTLNATVSSGAPVRDGFYFDGWARSSSGSASVFGGDVLSHVFSYTGTSQTYTYALYAAWRPKEYVVFYRKGNYGSGTDTSDTKIGGTTLTLRGRLYTRSGYYQSGWSTSAEGNTFAYPLNGGYTINAGITLYPYWSIIKSTITSVTASVPADGTTQGTVSINKPNADFVNKVVIEIGSRTEEYTNIDTSCTFTIPASWIDQIPESTSGVGKVYVYTYRNGSQVGSPDVKNFTITVPETVVPSVSMTSENMSDNATVDGWDTLVQGFSKIKLTATATAGSGSSIASIAFSGDGVSQSGTDLSVISDLLINSGARTWTVTATDKRGRTATATVTRIVHEYHTAAVQSLESYRSDMFGVDDPGTGTYITSTPVYEIASCDGHNTATVKKIEYKINTGSTWTVGQASAASGSTYTYGPISVLYAYDVRITVTDALGSTAVYQTSVISAIGFSFGMNGRCARLGGPVRYDDRFEVDFKTQLDDGLDVLGDLNVTGDANVGDLNATGNIDVTGNATFGGNVLLGNRQIMKSLWTGTWSTGDITVDGLSNYSVFLVKAAPPTSGAGGICFVATIAGENNEFFRGWGGHGYSTASNPNGRWMYALSAARSNDTLTISQPNGWHCVTNNDIYHPNITEIIGII